MAKMYHKEKSIQLKSSASALYNNLSVLRIAPRCLTYFTVVHANVVNMVSASWDGLNYSHRQLQSKEGNVATSSSLIMQVRLKYHLSPNKVWWLYWFSTVLPTVSNSGHCLHYFMFHLYPKIIINFFFSFFLTGSLVCPALKRSSCSHLSEGNTGGLSVMPC